MPEMQELAVLKTADIEYEPKKLMSRILDQSLPLM